MPARARPSGIVANMRKRNDSAVRSVAVAVTDGVPLFEVAIPCEVFGHHEVPGLPDPWYDFRLCAPRGRTRTAAGFLSDTCHGLDALVDADTVIVPACRSVHEEQPAELVAAVRAAHEAGARIVSLCSGAFVLAAAGVLDGRLATTHWLYADLLAERFPAVRVDPSALYIDNGDVLTSAGTAAGLDLCLHLVRGDHGPAVATTLAKRLVMPAHRPGGQAQYIDTIPASGSDGCHDDGLGPVLDWARQRLDQPITLADLAARLHCSGRTLIRRFQAAAGTTPLHWLRDERIRLARELLETTALPVDAIADRSGLGGPANLRHHFNRALGVSPSAYRRTFRTNRHL